MLKKIMKWVGILLIVAVTLEFIWLEYSTEKNRAVPTELALAALESDNVVTIEVGNWVVMRPANSSPTTGMIVYPGANCDIRGYAPLMREIAAAGYLVIALSMPYDFSIFAPGSASEVPPKFPEIDKWVLTGHSMGGAMAGTFAAGDGADMLDGVIMWDAYPASSLVDAPFPVTSIHRATLEGAAPDNFVANNHQFPNNAKFVPIPGGIHMYFGSFNGGGYTELWEPKISAAEQHKIIIAATIEALQEAEQD